MNPGRVPDAARPGDLPTVIEPSFAVFEYTGRTGLTVRGPITRRSYRFDMPGARVGVDRRDAPSIAAVPMLRRVWR